jgi:hypothetical protein
LIWSGFTAEGYQLQQRGEAVPGTLVNNDQMLLLESQWPVGLADSIRPILSLAIKSRQYPITNYKKSTKLLNFHSWRPYYEDPEFSFSLYGENILNTLQTEVYYLYNENEKTSGLGANAVYGGWFPQVSLGSQYTFDRTRSISGKTKQWDQVDSRIGLIIPLSSTSGRTIKNFNTGTYYAYRSDRIKGLSRQDFSNSNFSYLIHFINFSQQVPSAVQHIFPRLGYSLSTQFNHTISNKKSWQSLSGATLYLPGLASTHSLVLTAAWQETDTSNVFFGNRFSYSRGYPEAYFSRMWRGSANYHFPIIYPDWGFGNILYLLRIRGNAFYDFTRVYATDKKVFRDQRSAGGEIYFDTKWWNQYELSFGFRVSYLLDPDLYTRSKGTVVEFILPVSIFPR